jgi:glycosyltransferase involved in cell wall biosynthesis
LNYLILNKVLIITYYWPPAGGIAVQRWLKFAKYLPHNNWKPIIYTVSNGEYIHDLSLLKDIASDIEVIRRPIVEPHRFYRFLSLGKGKDQSAMINMKVSERSGWLEKLSLWVRGNLFIPDARFLWVRPSVRFLKKYLKTANVQAVISTGPPHSMHLIGMQLHEHLHIPWLADFRDPWTSMDYYQDLKLSKWADKKHHFLEEKVIWTANKVAVVGSTMKAEFENKGAKDVFLLSNGFDSEDFLQSSSVLLDDKFSLVHTGSFLPRRNPTALWKALSELQLEEAAIMQDLEIRLIGRVDQSVVNSIKHFNLAGYLKLVPSKPFKGIVGDIKSAQILMLPIDNFEGAKWVITGKLFEYMAAKRPILCIGPIEGDAAHIINSTNSGKVYNFSDVAGIKQQLKDWHRQFQAKSLTVESKQELYSLKELTHLLAAELNKLLIK